MSALSMGFQKQIVVQPFIVNVHSKEMNKNGVKIEVDRGMITMASQMLPDRSNADLGSKDQFTLELRKSDNLSYCLTLFKDNSVPINSIAVYGAALRQGHLHENYSVQGMDKLATHLISRSLPVLEKHLGIRNNFFHNMLSSQDCWSLPRNLTVDGWEPGEVCNLVLQHNAKALAYLTKKLESKDKATAAVKFLRLFARTLHTGNTFTVFNVDTMSSVPDHQALISSEGVYFKPGLCEVKWPGYVVHCTEQIGQCGSSFVVCRGVDSVSKVSGNGVIMMSSNVSLQQLTSAVAAATLSLGN